MDNVKLQKPFLKWVGGKTQIIDKILENFPKEINNYREIFLGGGSVLLAVLSLQKEKKIVIKNKIYANDINQVLISTYLHIQKNKEIFYKFVIDYKETFDKAKEKENQYYIMRDKYNSIKDFKNIEKCALFLILNKLCFRGLYREGPRGFNVPYGHYKKTPTIINKEELDKISDLIKDVQFTCSDYSTSLKEVQEKDFVYLDPPYAPENLNSFVKYTSKGFNLEDHKLLFDLIKQIDKKHTKFVLSNSKVELVLVSLKDYKYKELMARRAINSKNPSAKTKEIILYN